MPEETIDHADSVVIGEGEYVWPNILSDISKGRLKTLYESKKAIDLRDSPTPRFDMLKPKKYSSISIQTSRGCPHDCEYCSSSKIFGSKYRWKTVQQVLDEVKLVKKHFCDTQIFFSDDNFLVNKKYSTALLEKLQDLKIHWYAQSDIAIGADSERLKLMKKSGCTNIFIGLESVSPDGLRHIDRHGWKFKQLKHYSEFVQRIQYHGIGVIGAFMVGLDSDDPAIFEQIAEFVIKNHLMGASITIQTPLPGTRLRERLEGEGRLLPTPWNNYTGYSANHIPKKISIKDLENGLLHLYEKIYNEDVNLNKMKYLTELAIDRRKKRKLLQMQV